MRRKDLRMKRVVLVVILVILFLLLGIGLLTCSGKSDTTGHSTTSATPTATGSSSAGDTATVSKDSGMSGFGQPAPDSTPEKPHAFTIPFLDTLIHPTSLLHTGGMGDGVEYWRDSRLIFHQP